MYTPAGIVGLGLTGTFIAVAVLADCLAPTEPFTSVAPPLMPPSVTYPMGADDLGRSLASGVVHAEALSLTRRDFVNAARSLGASTRRILLRHILPNALPPTVVVISFNAASMILIEAGLSFLGLGDPDLMSWGYLANNAQRFLRVAWWMAIFPGTAMVLAIVGLNLLGDVLNDVLAPGSRH